VGTTSAASTNPVPTGVAAVRLLASTACYVKLGTSPTADTTTSFMLAPNFPEIFTIRPGEKVAVIQVSASGTLNITELTA
jgi:hypothetical protein